MLSTRLKHLAMINALSATPNVTRNSWWSYSWIGHLWGSTPWPRPTRPDPRFSLLPFNWRDELPKISVSFLAFWLLWLGWSGWLGWFGWYVQMIGLVRVVVMVGVVMNCPCWAALFAMISKATSKMTRCCSWTTIAFLSVSIEWIRIPNKKHQKRTVQWKWAH